MGQYLNQDGRTPLAVKILRIITTILSIVMLVIMWNISFGQ